MYIYKLRRPARAIRLEALPCEEGLVGRFVELHRPVAVAARALVEAVAVAVRLAPCLARLTLGPLEQPLSLLHALAVQRRADLEQILLA